MNALRVSAVFLLAILSTACSTVYSTKPLGSGPHAVTAEDWEGVWANEDGYLVLQAADAKAGLLRLAWIDDDLELKTYDVSLREAGSWVVGSVRDEDRPDRFLWARIKKDQNRIIVWTPSVSRIRALVEEGALPGTIEKGGDVTLGELTPEHLNLIASQSKGVLLDWEEPVVLSRMSR